MERVGRVAPVEDHLAPPETAPLGDRDEAPELRLGQILEELGSEPRERSVTGATLAVSRPRNRARTLSVAAVLWP